MIRLFIPERRLDAEFVDGLNQTTDVLRHKVLNGTLQLNL